MNPHTKPMFETTKQHPSLDDFPFRSIQPAWSLFGR